MNHAAPSQKKAFGHILGQQYTVFDGLAGMYVEAIYQDRHGLLWIGTIDGGVSRFDGAHFDTFGLSDGLPHLSVTTIVEDADGRLLFGTFGGGIAAYDGRGFQVYTTEHGLPSNDIFGLQPQADGSVRVLTSAGVGRFVEGRCVECMTELAGKPLGLVYDMATDSAGTTWLATQRRGVLSMDGQRMNTDSDDEHDAVQLQWPWNFAQDAAGNLWIGFRYVGTEVVVGRYDPASRQFEIIRVDDGAEGAEVVLNGTRHVRVDDRDRLWLSRRGVLVYDGEEWHPFSANLPGVHFSGTRLTYEDSEGNIWVGLWGGGLIFCDPISIQLYDKKDGLPDSEVRCLREDQEGRIWIGTTGGLACLEDGQIRPMEVGYTVLSMVVDRQGQVWSNGPEGQVFKSVGRETQAITVIAGGVEIKMLFQGLEGHLIACTAEGQLGRIEANRFIAIGELRPLAYRIVLQDREGSFWLGLYGIRPALYNYKDGHLRACDMAGIEAVGYVNALCEYQDAIWVGTAHGLFAIDYQAKEVRQFTVDQGDLSANGIMALMADPQQACLWIGTSGGGVLKYDGRGFQSIRLGKSALENIVDAILRDSQGQLWFGTRAGLIAYQPGETPPRIRIRQVVAGRTFDEPQSVSCPDSTPEIQFHFQGISFRSGAEQMRYSHRLVGYGPAEEWSAFAPANRVTYQDVPAGLFHFEVRTMDRDGLMSDVARLEMRVVPTRLRHLEQMLRVSNQGFLSQSQAMARLLEQVESMAETDMTVLVLGETGVGKGVLARLLHNLSPRQASPFISVNCGGLSAGLIESELFGHEKGAFTSANAQKIGYFERADGGTLFLDEVGDLPLESQRALLHILEEGHLTRVGGEQSIPVDVRVVAATNKDLEEAIQAGTFREDLFYRLSVLSLVLPPLRERQEDIPLLAAHFASRCAEQLGRPTPVLGEEVVVHLQQYAWPGNVRELEHVIQQAVVLGDRDVIQVADVPFQAAEAELALPTEPSFDWGAEDEDEKQRILAALQATNWRIYGPRGAARLLSMGPEKLRYRMRKHGLQRPEKPSP
ncbi:MAG: sigma 54-interacting transcriptional regulator [Gemmatimonadota bacterium]|nr:sigma 54-interacting transcriptional regulator [Gemmatimonadota bacterium]